MSGSFNGSEVSVQETSLFFSSNTLIILSFFRLAPVVQKLDRAIHRITRYPAGKYYENQLRYPLDSDLSSEECYPPFEQSELGVFQMYSDLFLFTYAIKFFFQK